MNRPSYDSLIAQGVEPKLAEMLSDGRPPGLRTGNEFFTGQRTNGSQFAAAPAMGEKYAAEARRMGVSTAGKYYSHQLADYPGDPKAWVSDVDDFKRLARERGAGCEPLGLKTIMRNDEPTPALADDLVAEEVTMRVHSDPDLAAKVKENPRKLDELKAQVIEDHKPHWA